MEGNIYQRLQLCRVELAKKDVHKGCENTFAKYKYFELADFLPEVQRLSYEAGLCGIVTFTVDIATLQIVDIEKPDSFVVFTSPMADAQLKGAHPIQNMGAVETYQRRYLYMAALEITEADKVDASKPEKKPIPPAAWGKAVERMRAGEDLADMLVSTYELTEAQLQSLQQWKTR